MADVYRIEIHGDAAVVAAFRKLGLDSGDLQDVFGRIATDVAGDARSLAPKRSGALAGSVKPGRRKLAATITAGGSVPYAGPINFGWASRNIRPSLFMQRAADTKADASAEQIAAEMQRLIDQHGLG